MYHGFENDSDSVRYAWVAGFYPNAWELTCWSGEGGGKGVWRGSDEAWLLAS